jgi:predicted branched-subunit amino acid permease
VVPALHGISTVPPSDPEGAGPTVAVMPPAPAIAPAPPPPAAPRLADRRPMAAGARAMAPWLVGMGLYGLVVGVSAGRAGIPALAGWLTAPTVYSGGAQVATIDLLDHGAGPLVVVATTLAVNSRLIVYSAAMGGRWAATPRWWRALAAYLLVDPSFAVGSDGYARSDETGDAAAGHAHYLGAALALWVTWVGAVGVGTLAAGRLPDALALEFVIPLFLAAEVQRRPATRATRRAVVVAAAVAVAGAAFLPQLALLAAIVAATGTALATRETRR